MVKKVKVKSLSCVRLFVILWTVAYEALPSMGFSRQEYWNGLPYPSPGDLLDPAEACPLAVRDEDCFQFQGLAGISGHRLKPKEQGWFLTKLFSNQWTVSCQASLSMGFSRQEYWSGCFMGSWGVVAMRREAEARGWGWVLD